MLKMALEKQGFDVRIDKNVTKSYFSVISSQWHLFYDNWSHLTKFEHVWAIFSIKNNFSKKKKFQNFSKKFFFKKIFFQKNFFSNIFFFQKFFFQKFFFKNFFPSFFSKIFFLKNFFSTIFFSKDFFSIIFFKHY